MNPESSQTAPGGPSRTFFHPGDICAPRRLTAVWTGRTLAEIVEQICNPELQTEP